MSENLNEMNVSIGKLNKKNSKKGTNQIPLASLGFRAKVFYDTSYEYVPRKKYPKYSNYEKQKRQHNFRTRLSYIIDPSHATHQQIGDMKFKKRAEWKQIKFVIFRTKQQLACCICLAKEFIAPQMTFCGHVFCWHCILMHYEKSLKATSCPVCNEIFQLQQLKTCTTLFLPPISAGDRIGFRLKTRTISQKIIFDPQSLQQETSLSHVIRMKNESTLERYNTENDEILNEMKKNQDPQTQKCLIKILQRSQDKIDELIRIVEEDKNYIFKPHKHEIFVGGTLCRTLSPQELSSQKLMTFYQQQGGRYAYLHPICEKYLLKNFQSEYLPLKIQEQVLLKEQTEYSHQNVKKFKYLSHLPENQDFDFIFIRMNELIDYKLFEQFQKEFQLYKKKKLQITERQEEYAKLLNDKYEKQKEYIRELKKMEESQFHDIKVPINMVDLSQIQDANVFPSLVQTTSNSQSNFDSSTVKSQQKSIPIQFGKKNKKAKHKFVLAEEDFPGLQLAVKMSMEQTASDKLQIQQDLTRNFSQKPLEKHQPQENDFPLMSNDSKFIGFKGKKQEEQNQQKSNGKKKGKKKNKQKFIDVTHQFFIRNQEDD